MRIYKICSQLRKEEEDLGVEKIEPVWGVNLSATEYYSYSASRTRNGLQILKPGELGCTLSHLKVLEKIVETEVPSLILESDIFINKGAIDKIQEYIASFPETQFLHCARYNDRDFKCWHLKDGRRIVDTSYKFWGTCAYYSSKKTALALLNFHQKYGPGLADDWHRFFSESSIVPYYYRIFDHPSQESTIQNQGNPRSYAASLSRMVRTRIALRISFMTSKAARTLKYGILR